MNRIRLGRVLIFFLSLTFFVIYSSVSYSEEKGLSKSEPIREITQSSGDRLASLIEENKSLLSKIEERDQLIEYLSSRVRELTSKEEDLAKAKEDIQQLKDRLAAQEKEILNITRRSDNLSLKIKEKDAQIQKLISKIEAVAQERQVLKQSLSRSSRQDEQLRDQLAAQEKTAESLYENNKALTLQIKEKDNLIKDLNSRIAETTQDEASLKKSLTDANQEIQQLKDQLASQEKAALDAGKKKPPDKRQRRGHTEAYL